MKIGIYISGLGKSYIKESVEKYSQRLLNEINYTITGFSFDCKVEFVQYTIGKETKIVSFFREDDSEKIVYKIYDFDYEEALTNKFKKYSLIKKNLYLLFFISRKSPVLIKKLFFLDSFKKTLQTFFLFILLFLITLSIILAFPAMIEAAINFGWENQFFSILLKIALVFTAIVLFLIPNGNILISNLATEFVCASDYLEFGKQKSLVQGNLEKLVEYISENESNPRIHFHAYSFGSIIALDYIYPFGDILSKNAEKLVECLITIGTPYEFVKSYYPNFYDKRNIELGNRISWINVYSTLDVLATNFRNDEITGEAEFGICSTSKKPINLNYNVSSIKGRGFLDVVLLYSFKVHKRYWDEDSDGQSCLRLVLREMRKLKLI